MSALVNRRKEQTRREIVETALALFADHGFDDTSMEQIAAAAGVSRRTIYRYFVTKDDLVFEAPRHWLAVLNGTLATRKADEPTRDVFRRALLDVARFIQADRESVIRAFAILMASPSLMARHGRSDAEWTARYMQIIGPDVAGEADAHLVAMTAAMALVAAQNALIAVWATSQPDSDLVAMTELVIDQVDSVWPAGSRRIPH